MAAALAWFWVSVPVLSDSTISIMPSSSFRFDVRAWHGWLLIGSYMLMSVLMRSMETMMRTISTDTYREMGTRYPYKTCETREEPGDSGKAQLASSGFADDAAPRGQSCGLQTRPGRGATAAATNSKKSFPRRAPVC